MGLGDSIDKVAGDASLMFDRAWKGMAMSCNAFSSATVSDETPPYALRRSCCWIGAEESVVKGYVGNSSSGVELVDIDGTSSKSNGASSNGYSPMFG